MYGNNAYNKDTDILVVQESIITVTKLTKNKLLLSLLNRTTRFAHKKNRSISTIIARYNTVIQVRSCILASLARNVKAVKTFYPGCIGTPKADITIVYCTLNNFRPVANK